MVFARTSRFLYHVYIYIYKGYVCLPLLSLSLWLSLLLLPLLLLPLLLLLLPLLLLLLLLLLPLLLLLLLLLLLFLSNCAFIHNSTCLNVANSRIRDEWNVIHVRENRLPMAPQNQLAAHMSFPIEFAINTEVSFTRFDTNPKGLVVHPFLSGNSPSISSLSIRYSQFAGKIRVDT